MIMSSPPCTTMRSPLGLLILGCVVLFPNVALGKQVPIFVYRDLPTSSPTSTPSYQPTARPSSQPTSSPSFSPSSHPSSHPTSNPSLLPSSQPTSRPSLRPSSSPSFSTQPSSQPTINPSTSPTISQQPSLRPSFKPTNKPSVSVAPSSQPSETPPPPYLRSYASFMQNFGLSPSPVGFWLACASAVIFATVVTFGVVKWVQNPRCLCASGKKQSSRDRNDDYDTSQASEEEKMDEEEGEEDWKSAVNEMLSYWVPISSPSGDEQSSIAFPNPRTQQKNVPASRKDVLTPTPHSKSSRMDVYISPVATPTGRKKHKRQRGEGRVKTPRHGQNAGQLVRQRTGELSIAVTETFDQAITGLSTIGSNTKEFAEKTRNAIGDGASNAAMVIEETSEGILMSLGGGDSSYSGSSAEETSLGEESVSSKESSGGESASTIASLASRDSNESATAKTTLQSLLSQNSASSGSSCNTSGSDEDDDDSDAPVDSDRNMKAMATNEHTAESTAVASSQEISATASYENYVPTYNYRCM